MHAFADETRIKKVALYAGLIALAAGIGMAFEYGRAMSMLHAISLSLLAIAASLGFVGADILRAKGRITAASIISVATIGLLFAEYGTHFGYTVGHRVREAQETSVQNATHKAVQDNREAERTNLAMWQEQLKTLMAQNAWAPTVKADGLRAELDALKDRMAKEEQGQRGRKAGKGREFERLQDQANAVASKIAIVEQASDLTKRIEATQRLLDKKVETAAATKFHSSKIVNQTAAFAQIAMWDDKPSESAISWTQLVLGAIIAAVTTYLAPFFFSIAFADIRMAARSAPQAPSIPMPKIITPAFGPGPAGIVLSRRTAQGSHA